MPPLLLAWFAKAVAWHDRLMAIPAFRSWIEILWLLAGISGAYWLLCKIIGRVALLIHRVLDHSLAELFAVLYNIALSVLFSSVLVHAAIVERGAKNDFLAFEAAGFVLVYLVLDATYREPTGEISEHALPGYWGGLAAYLFFCLRTQYLQNPVTPRAYEAVAWFMRSGLARIATLFAVAAFILKFLQRLRRRFSPFGTSPARAKIKTVPLERS